MLAPHGSSISSNVSPFNAKVSPKNAIDSSFLLFKLRHLTTTHVGGGTWMELFLRALTKEQALKIPPSEIRPLEQMSEYVN